MTSNMYKQLIFSSAAAAIIAIASAPASAQSRLSEMETASEINAANKLLRDGKVDEALEAFRHVVPGDGQRSELNYNMAVAEYRKGNIDAAEKLFGEVAGTSANHLIEQSLQPWQLPVYESRASGSPGQAHSHRTSA
jgi:TolA-binding protein